MKFLFGVLTGMVLLLLLGATPSQFTINGVPVSGINTTGGLTANCQPNVPCLIDVPRPTLNKKPFQAITTGRGIAATCNDLGSCYMQDQLPSNENLR